MKPQCKLLQGVDVIKRLLSENSDVLCNGMVYRKVPEGKYSFVAYKSIRNYILNNMGDMAVAEAVTNQFVQIVALLSEPECRLLEQAKIDYNYIEVIKFLMIF